MSVHYRHMHIPKKSCVLNKLNEEKIRVNLEVTGRAMGGAQRHMFPLGTAEQSPE